MGKGTCWTGFWMGAGIAGFTMLAAMFGPHVVSMKAIERNLQVRVEQALAAKGYRDVAVKMDGQTAILSGAMATAEMKAAVQDTVLRAAGRGGPFFGGVTRVNDQTVVGARVSPFGWNAEKSAAGLVLAGHVPSEAARARLLDIARTRYPGMKITDRMAAALGAPTGDWTAMASDALTQLSKMTRGKARLTDDRLTVIGEGEQAAVADVRAHYNTPLAAPFTLAVADLTVVGQSLGIAEVEGLNLSEASAETCQRAFSQLMRTNVIEFDTSSATIAPSSQLLLDHLATVARRCDQYTIAVAGHTDNVGDARLNLTLSRTRAEAVRDYLAGKGVDRDRLTAQGFGQEKPRVPNTTAANRARNRRIEFNVS